MDTLQRRTFNYFWEGAEPNSGLACERIHIDGIYPEDDQNVVTTGGSGFESWLCWQVSTAVTSPVKKGWRAWSASSLFLKQPTVSTVPTRWWFGDTGRVKPFGQKDNGGDLVETAFLMQGLLAVHQYYINGSPQNKPLAGRIDTLWREVDWNFYRRNDQNVLYWHWSPEYGWEMNFPVHGYNECLIMYILAAASPTHSIPATVYHEGWGRKRRHCRSPQGRRYRTSPALSRL